MKYLLSVLTLCLSCLYLPVSANAQAVGSISGRVTDATSAIVPGATVTVLNQGTNAERTVQADSSGNFASTRCSGRSPPGACTGSRGTTAAKRARRSGFHHAVEVC